MAEVRFYHLTGIPLERALPTMLERLLARGQRGVVRGGHAERLRFLDGHLWTYAEESFLPHGIEGAADPAAHPIWLTTGDSVPNDAQAIFLIDGATAALEEMSAMEVTALLFDGHDPAAVEAARAEWRRVTAAGLAAVYWAQEGGRWVRKHEAAGRDTPRL